MVVIIIFLILSFIGLIVFYIKNDIEGVGICGISFGMFLMITLLYYNKEIKPIDVYRGNTTLEITYKDGVAIDSVVVWKNK